MLQAMKGLGLLVLLAVVVDGTTDTKKGCLCDKPELCNSLSNDWKDATVEVTIAGDSRQDVATLQKWRWTSFSSILDLSPQSDANSTAMMCKAHKEGKKYGFYISDHPSINATDAQVKTYTDDLTARISMRKADMVGLDLLDLLGRCDYAKAHVIPLIKILNATITAIKKTQVKVICGMPWRPPCFDSDCGITEYLAKQCDAIMLIPRSYFDYCEDACIAKATIQYSKISFGLNEYMAYGVGSKQIMLGIPWHGYNYTCETFTASEVHGICALKKKTVDGVEVCDVEGSRVRDRLGKVEGRKVDLAYQDHTYSVQDQACFKVQVVEEKVGNDTKNVTHMTWFENIGSLFYKYEQVKKLNLKGCVVFTGDDLTYTKMKGDKFNDNMWAWILHELLSSNSTMMNKEPPHTASLMAGIGVGMFLLGTVMGVVIACVIFRRKKNLRPPFSQDPYVDDYRDDDHENNEL